MKTAAYMDDTTTETAAPESAQDSVSRVRAPNPGSEIVRLLDLKVAQIELAMRESDASVASLTDAFAAIADGVQSVESTVEALSDDEPVSDKAELRQICRRLSEQVGSAVMALQFHDRLTQRLQHVSNSLTSLAGVAGDASRLHCATEWDGLKEALRSSYSGEAEKAVFDAVMGGATTEEALRQLADTQQADDNAEVELF